MLEAIPIAKTRVKADEFWTFIESIKDGTRRFELIEGEIIEMPSASPIHPYIMSFLTSILFSLIHSNNLGYGFGDGCAYYLADDYVFIPDVSFVSSSKTSIPFPKKFTFAPDLAVEVISPTNTIHAMRAKIEAYLRYGTKLVWVVYPDAQSVDVWRAMPDGSLNVRPHTMTDSLSGESILPNFSLPIQEIFKDIKIS